MEEITKLALQKEKIIKKLKTRETIIGSSRFLVFIISIYYIVKFFLNKNESSLYFGIAFFIIFILLGINLLLLRNKIQRCKDYIQICEIINKDFCESNIFKSSNNYLNDFDIFGKNSLFSKIYKTQTYIGKVKLKNFFLKNENNSVEINNNQSSIQEISKKLLWAVDFLTKTKALNINSDIYLNKFSPFEKSKNSYILKKILLFYPIINLVFIICCVIFSISIYKISLYILIAIIISSIISQKYNFYNKNISKSIFSSSQYEEFIKIFSHIEQEKFISQQNKNLQKKLFSENRISATKTIDKFSRLIRNYENGKTPILGFLLNVFFLWNLQHSTRISDYSQKIENDFHKWIDVVSEFEAFISLGIFAYKNDNYVYPSIVDSINQTSMVNIFHPLINSKIAIKNNFYITKNNNIAIITGANMTGKSTFLRTFGVNLVLAMIGCPVAATEFSFYPMSLFSSMRTNDSLLEGSSYFDSEIKKLRLLIENLEKKQPQYIILDEILKGTNSQDKLTGSKLFLEKILKINTPFFCMIATHDLDLTKMEHNYPNNIDNYCFELNQNIDNKLEPDYKLRKGVTKTMNAIRLMKEYKIID